MLCVHSPTYNAENKINTQSIIIAVEVHGKPAWAKFMNAIDDYI